MGRCLFTLVGHPYSGVTIKMPVGVDVLFPIGLVKTESDFILRSVKTGLKRWVLVVAAISVNAYPFLALSDLTCHLEYRGIGVFCFLPVIQKDYTTHMHGLAVYAKEALRFAWQLSLKNPGDLYWCFPLASLHLMSYFFFLYESPSLSLYTAFDSISCNIDKVLLIIPSANVLVFGDLTSIIRTG